MDNVRDCMEDLVNAIRASDEYQNFKEAEERVADVPGLVERIREYCWKNYRKRRHKNRINKKRI